MGLCPKPRDLLQKVDQNLYTIVRMICPQTYSISKFADTLFYDQFKWF